MLTLAFTGDVMLGRYVNEQLKHITPAEMWDDLLPHLAQADLRIVNLECALTSHSARWNRTEKMFHFRADPKAVRVLQVADIDACVLANNHILDYEDQGLLETLHILRAAGIRYAGAGANAAKAAAPAMLEVQGTSPCTVALLAFTDNEPAFAAAAGHPGTNYLEVALDKATLARVADSIAQAREQGAALVVFSNHWGANFVERPAPEFREFARRVIELGADIYYGHSAHICQGIEIHQGKPILYDTGNFIDDYAVHPQLRNDRSCLFKVMFEQGRLSRIELLPVSLDLGYVALARGKEFEVISARMEMLCAEFGTKLARRPDRLVYEAWAMAGMKNTTTTFDGSRDGRPKVALALGSGSARGLAHLGVIRAIEEAGIEVDFIAGTSMGALVGAIHAAGKLDDLEAAFLGFDWKKTASFFDVVLPKSGLLDGAKVSELVRAHIHADAIELLAKPFAAVATDIVSGEEVVIRSGDAIEAVRASISVPGIFTPVRSNGRILVDGGLTNPVPVSAARTMGADIVIAVDLNHQIIAGKNLKPLLPAAKTGVPNAPGIFSRWVGDYRLSMQDIRQKLLAGDTPAAAQFKKWNSAEPLPSIFEVLLASINIMETRLTQTRLLLDRPDVIIQPPLGHIRFLEFGRADEIIAIGYEHTQRQLGSSGMIAEILRWKNDGVESNQPG